MTEVLEAATLNRPRISLLSSGNIVPVEGPRWERAFETWTEGCEVAALRDICDPDDNEADGQGELQEYRPYVAFASDTCSTYPSKRDFWGRAERKLLLAESTLLEEQLWLGTAGGNPFLTDTPITITSATSSYFVSRLDQALGEITSGQGMIHIRPILLGQLLFQQQVRLVGNVYLSPMGNIVVPGRGYNGTGPAGQAVGATEWVYAHPGIVEIRHSEIMYTPGKDDLAAQITRSTNDRTVEASRVTHVALDPTCDVLALAVTNVF